MLVEAHGGQITAESIYGEGSTFSFTLPTNKVEMEITPNLSLR
jgi:signal transduction histidine kinase